jgi:hypothetical protein
MTSIEPSTTFRRVSIPAADSPASGSRSRVVKAQDVETERLRLHEVRAATRSADDIVAEARVRAEALLRSAEAQAQETYVAKIATVESEMAEQLDHVARQLGDAVAIGVESIFRSIFHTDPTLPLAATIEIARKVLHHEVGSVLRVNPREVDHHYLPSLGDAYRVEPSHDVPAGTAVLAGHFGEIKVDAQRLISDLSRDLRKAFQRRNDTDSHRPGQS